uniref:Uncharacterized protein LOC111100295 n=1 Tax=Crassostrea virginica TaxID=6565 RepID=A0A8B8AB44_CRAVI|nr:uncharacterized protein LOC111100295 [Crassostrea virginica]
MGFNHSEILMSLALNHRIIISMRSLRRHMANMRLYRRKNYSDIFEVAVFIMEQVEKSGQLHGYKLLHLKCIQNGFVVSQESVRLLLLLIDPNGVEIRKRNRLRRRQYSCSGPDYIWHVDSYDKLKPYGFCINGCIDGFSRRIIWMEVYTSNSNPALIASYYLDAVKLRKGCPRKLRLDRGTENSYIAQMQIFLRTNHEDDESNACAIFGSSNHNQRIESWWGFLRKHCCQFWMNTFQGLKDIDKFNGEVIDKNILQFCFMQMIQDELEDIVELWNTHRIRPYRNRVTPSGRPTIMYDIPYLYGARRNVCQVTEEQITACQTVCRPKSQYPCDKTVYELCCLIMEESNLDEPHNPSEGLQLYTFLRNAVHLQL